MRRLCALVIGVAGILPSPDCSADAQREPEISDAYSVEENFDGQTLTRFGRALINEKM